MACANLDSAADKLWSEIDQNNNKKKKSRQVVTEPTMFKHIPLLENKKKQNLLTTNFSTTLLSH